MSANPIKLEPGQKLSESQLQGIPSAAIRRVLEELGSDHEAGRGYTEKHSRHYGKCTTGFLMRR